MSDAGGQPYGPRSADADARAGGGLGSAAAPGSAPSEVEAGEVEGPSAGASFVRLVGDLQPSDAFAGRALVALGEKRLSDAEKHIAAIAETSMVSRGWKLLLRGLLAIEIGELAVAEPLLLQAAAVGFVVGASGAPSWGGTPDTGSEGSGVVDEACELGLVTLDFEGSTETGRLVARALHRLGWVYRRQDRVGDAKAAHIAAWRLRERLGSYEELWETAIELGLNADVVRNRDEARAWHGRAVELAQRSAREPSRREAIAWDHLATTCLEGDQFEEAVSAAKRARACWYRHDPAAVSAARAELKLATTLLRHGQCLLDKDSHAARTVLTEAMDWLNRAEQELLPYGQVCAADAQLCREQKDFAERLLATLTP